jgi:ectoine hydroxylase-related dioxygenase (phytanoyl-CoA dioxygenase family)
VRGILFDKTTAPGGSNWKVPYHQDLSIAVRERPSVSVPGYETWSVKDGVTHVQPPVALLERLITVRLHLDPCDAAMGALRVLPGTHRLERLGASEITRCRSETAETVCEVPEGGVLMFRPLLLHASSPATRPGARRRVLHLEFAPANMSLPAGISWFEQTACR